MTNGVVDLGRRSLTALLLTAGAAGLLVLGALWEHGSWLLAAMVLITNSLAAGEFGRICAARIEKRERWQRWGRTVIYGTLAAGPSWFLFFSVSLSQRMAVPCDAVALTAAALAGVALAALGVGLYLVLVGRRDLIFTERAAKDLPLGFFLVGVCGVLLLALAARPEAWRLLSWLLLVVCVNDVGAYLVGSKLGGPKLAPQISPRKTISGSLGGLVFGLIAAVAGAGLLWPQVGGWGPLLGAAVLVIIAAQLGDLMKSYIKRLHAVKDSGTLLPGHGGVWDRVDGILAGGAMLFLWLLP